MSLPDFIGVAAIVGDEGSGKSSMSLSFPQPIFHFDVDVGGFDRAIWRMRKENPNIRIKQFKDDEDITKIKFSDYDILTKSYPKPLQVKKLLGQLMGPATGQASVRQISLPKKVEGMRELWQVFVNDFVYVCQVECIKTMIFDSATQLWNIAHESRLQELQEIQEYKWRTDSRTAKLPFDENEYRERLQPIEYGQPNDRMQSLFHTARSFRKNLILTQYPTDEYGMVSDGKGGVMEGKTGKRVMDGFKNTTKLCDLVVWTSVRDANGAKSIVAKIEKCGLEGMGLGAVGLEIAASFQGIESLKNLMGGV